MRVKFWFTPMLSFIFCFAATPVFSQARWPAEGGLPPYEAGGGFTNAFVSSSGNSRSFSGGTAWADWNPTFLPQRLHGLGLEGEFRTVSKDVPAGQYEISRLVTPGGGFTYSWDHFTAFHPYAKFLIVDGVIHYYGNSTPPTSYSDSRVLYVPGGGVDCRLYSYIRLRAEYEYLPWTAFSAHSQDIMVGLAYDFRGFKRGTNR